MADWIAAVGGLAGFIAFALTAWDRHRNKDVPAPQLSILLLEARDYLQEVVSSGGKSSAWFLESPQKRQMEELSIYAMRVRSDKIFADLSAVLITWDSAWTTGNDTDTLRDQQIEYARAGASAATRAINSINAAIRKAPTAPSS